MTEAHVALQQRERLACGLGILLITLVLVFCLLSVLAPDFMGAGWVLFAGIVKMRKRLAPRGAGIHQPYTIWDYPPNDTNP